MPSVLERACELTSRAFSAVEAERLRYGEFELVWLLYDMVHLRCMIPLALNEAAWESTTAIDLAQVAPEHRTAARVYASWRNKPLREAPRQNPKARLRLCLGGWVMTVVFGLLSLPPLLKLAFTRRPRAAVWTDDFLNDQTGGDFRLGDLYQRLAQRGVPCLDLVRLSRDGVRPALANYRRRPRPALYYEACTAPLAAFARAPAIPLRQPADPLAVAVFGAFADRLRGARARVGGLRRLLRWTGVRHLVGWEFANRQALLTIAAKCEGIPVSGFMHGAGMRTYMAHEFMPQFQAARPHGPDRFGVWSEWWREYYQRQSKLYGSVEVSGPMRPAAVLAKGEREPREGPLRVLWISEPLIHPSEVIDYLDAVRARHELVIKIRPANKDRFYSALLELRPDYAQTPAVDGSIHEAVANADVVVGSHSTAVIEASLQETPFVLVATQQWGDYFEVADGVQPALYVTTPADLLLSIDAHGTAPDRGRIRQLRERFFGQPGASGTAWLAEVVTADVGAVAT